MPFGIQFAKIVLVSLAEPLAEQRKPFRGKIEIQRGGENAIGHFVSKIAHKRPPANKFRHPLVKSVLIGGDETVIVKPWISFENGYIAGLAEFLRYLLHFFLPITVVKLWIIKPFQAGTAAETCDGFHDQWPDISVIQHEFRAVVRPWADWNSVSHNEINPKLIKRLLPDMAQVERQDSFVTDGPAQHDFVVIPIAGQLRLGGKVDDENTRTDLLIIRIQIDDQFRAVFDNAAGR